MNWMWWREPDLKEIERLHEENEKLRVENAAMRELLQTLKSGMVKWL